MDRDREARLAEGVAGVIMFFNVRFADRSNRRPVGNFFGNVRLNGDWKMTRSEGGKLETTGLASRKIVPDGGDTYARTHTGTRKHTHESLASPAPSRANAKKPELNK